MNYSFRPASSDDMAAILSFRNHPEVVKWTRSQDLVSEENHQSWFYSDKANKFCLLIEGTLVGFIYFSQKKEGHTGFEWSFFSDQKHPTNGIGRIILSIALYEFRSKWPNEDTLWADVHTENLKSRRLHESLGFLPSFESASDPTVTRYSKSLVKPVTLF
jgi:L-amino acid N-acyltransferase YncA